MSDEKPATPAKKCSLIKCIILGLFAFVAIVVVFVILACMLWLKPIATKAIESRTGYKVQIQKLTVNPFTANAELDGFVLTNPDSDFKTPDFVNLQTLHAKLQLTSLFKDTLVIESGELNLPSITVVHRSSGPSNIELFVQRLTADSTTAQQPAPKPDEKKTSEPSKPFQFLIKELKVNLGQIVLINEPVTGAQHAPYQINYSYTYKNVSKPMDFLTKDLVLSLLKFGGQFTDMIPGSLGGKAGTIIQGAAQAIQNPGDALQQGLNLLKPKK